MKWCITSFLLYILWNYCEFILLLSSGARQSLQADKDKNKKHNAIISDTVIKYCI